MWFKGLVCTANLALNFKCNRKYFKVCKLLGINALMCFLEKLPGGEIVANDENILNMMRLGNGNCGKSQRKTQVIYNKLNSQIMLV